MSGHQTLLAQIADLIGIFTPPSESANGVASEASVGAIWGVICRYVASGRAMDLPNAAATLAFLALTPELGAQAAVDAVRQEQLGIAPSNGGRDRKHQVKKLDRSKPKRHAHLRVGRSLTSREIVTTNRN
jgi:hypothetical protein